MRRRMKSLCLLLILLAMFSCEKESKTIQYPFTSFHRLIVDNDISIRLIQDSADYIDIIGPARVVDNINPQINGDTIHLKNEKSNSNYFEQVWAEVHFTDFKVLFLRNGGSVVNSDTLQFSSFSLASNGAMGDVLLNMNCENLLLSISTGGLSIKINGSTSIGRIWTTAPGLIDLRDLQADQITCTNNSSNNCYVWATNKLSARAEYSGKIFYRGTPEIILIPEGQEINVLPLNL